MDELVPLLVPFACPRHGWICDTALTARVWHTCGLEALPPAELIDERRSARARSAGATRQALHRARKGAGQSVGVSRSAELASTVGT
jgi:hypothetical protein